MIIKPLPLLAVCYRKSTGHPITLDPSGDPAVFKSAGEDTEVRVLEHVAAGEGAEGHEVSVLYQNENPRAVYPVEGGGGECAVRECGNRNMLLGGDVWSVQPYRVIKQPTTEPAPPANEATEPAPGDATTVPT